ncbi:serine/threonine-protein kinase [Streptomyces sp. AM 4-1-1]|uniref:serine/threonine-protein kinase n=1 Tax=Streptomyces sp. AM 4-1-1 TaxID=3028710 RepID=UPI0023B9E5F0|nr:serine/threonine-protein kinase [Streptomyces sp. AM 4-1-1]WEH34927.1 serine/threonine-protein kinase [Streptomyces sp. AM 4-1-1]
MENLGSGDPQRIGAYRLLGRLGAGGMGQVYLARSDRGRTVAIKLVRGELAQQREFRDRFRQEVRAAHRVGGSWTAPVLDADTEAPVPWVATGYVAGPSLQTVVTGRAGAPVGPASGAYGPLPERSVRILGSGLAHALQDIHTAGLIHRDLKPSNVLLTIDGPRVIDFGIARALETVTDGGLTRTGALVGSPGFMAPEQVKGERITPACDVFCLGSVLAYAATGRLPFGAKDSGAHALMYRIAQEEPDLARLPVGLRDLVHDCLAKDPEARPTTAAILDHLAEAGGGAGNGGGGGGEPWLPGALIAQLGRHAVGLLDSEDPETIGDAARPGERPPTVPEQDAAPATPFPLHPPTASPSAAPPPSVPPLSASLPPVDPQYTPPYPPTAVPATPPDGPHAFPTTAGPVAPPPPPPGYGHPQQPPPPPGYGYPQHQPPAPLPPLAHGSTPPYGPPYPTHLGPVPTPEPERRRVKGSTIALVVVAILVAVGAGGSVYAFMNGDDGNSAAPSPTTSATRADTETGTEGGSPDPSRSPSSSPSPDESDHEGSIPSGYLGSWSGTIDGAAGRSTRELVIRQGEVGETVLTLTAKGPTDTGGSYRCVFQADLESEPSPDAPIHVGPSVVTVGEPMTSCTPGRPTTLTLLPDGTLRRETTDTGERVTYTKTG